MVRTTDQWSDGAQLGAERDGTMLGHGGNVGTSDFSYENLPLVGSVEVDVIGSYRNQHMMVSRNRAAQYRHQR